MPLGLDLFSKSEDRQVLLSSDEPSLPSKSLDMQSEVSLTGITFIAIRLHFEPS